MKKAKIILLISLCFLFSCSREASLQRNKREALYELTEALHSIDTVEELALSCVRLQKLYNNIASTIIQLRRYQESNRISFSISEEDVRASLLLQQEIERLYQIEGGQLLLEQCQAEALFQLDVFDKK